MKQPIASSLALALAILLPACGGEGGAGGLASTPPPAPVAAPATTPAPTPTPASNEPLTTTGAYDAIAIASDASGQAASSLPGELTLSIDRERNGYSLTINQPAGNNPMQAFAGPGGVLSTSDSILPSGDRIANRLYLFGNLRSQDLPFHASLGLWEGKISSPPPSDAVKNSANALFVYGHRTPPADIPVAGKATYAWQFSFAEGPCDCTGSASLNADFAARTMAAEVGGGGFSGDKYFSVKGSGSGPLSSLGDFGFGLTGTFTIGPVGGGTDSTSSVTGWITGALFGPRAEDAASVFNFPLPALGSFSVATIGKRQ